MFVGSVDWGTRYALYRKWTGGIAQTQGTTNVDIWRHWFPLLLAGALTSVISAPLEVAERAYIGDLTFPEKLRYGYKSRFHALFSLATKNPFALYKNSSPSIAASFVQTTMAFGLYDYMCELFHPISTAAECPQGSVKFASAHQLCRDCRLSVHRLLLSPRRQRPKRGRAWPEANGR